MNSIKHWRQAVTVQRFESKGKATKEELDEAKSLMEGLSFTETVSCCDGYESWSKKVEDMDSFVELIKRSRQAAEIARPVTAWTSVDEFDYNVSHICIIAWARKMPMSMGSYEDGYFTLYDTEDCGIFEGDAEWFKDNFEFYMPSPLQPARSST